MEYWSEWFWYGLFIRHTKALGSEKNTWVQSSGSSAALLNGLATDRKYNLMGQEGLLGMLVTYLRSAWYALQKQEEKTFCFPWRQRKRCVSLLQLVVKRQLQRSYCRTSWLCRDCLCMYKLDAFWLSTEEGKEVRAGPPMRLTAHQTADWLGDTHFGRLLSFAPVAAFSLSGCEKEEDRAEKKV